MRKKKREKEGMRKKEDPWWVDEWYNCVSENAVYCEMRTVK